MATPLAPPPAAGPPWARGWRSLALAHGLAVVAGAASAVLYGAWLDPRGFAQWAGALGLARALQMLLDGGLRVALVRQVGWPEPAALRRLQRAVTLAAAGLLVLLSGGVVLALQRALISAPEGLLWWGASAAYLMTYPPQLVALARLERAGRFGAVGRAEGLGTLVEFAGPVPLMAAGLAPPVAFVLALLLGRCLRCLGLLAAAARLAAPSSAEPGLRRVLRDALAVQVVAALSLLRDLQHLWWLGPLAGAAWAGRYAFALMAAGLVAQVAAQTAARVALPQLAATAPAERWPLVLAQVRWLALATLPPLALLAPVLQQLDSVWWQGRWAEALPLVAWLALRMVGGVLSTPLGAALLVSAGPRRAAAVHARWTAVEVVLALAFTAWLGPVGLAVAGAAGVWFGNALMLHALQSPASATPALAARQLLLALLLRPSAGIGGLLALLAWSGQALGQGDLATTAAALALPLAWWAEPQVRSRLRRKPACGALAVAEAQP